MSCWQIKEGSFEKGEVSAEVVPSRSGEVSALASANAPFVVFDDASFAAIKGYLGMITLTAERPIAGSENGVVFDLVVVANIRATIPALRQLQEAINAVIALDERDRDRKSKEILAGFDERMGISGDPLPPEPTKN